MHAVEIKGGLLRINYISDGRLFRKVAISDVTVNGQPIRSVSELNEVIYNYSCVCDLYGVVRHRIFDFTHGTSFE
ncbi:hypothetical protein [Elizabethkingia phage TCUEAP1]|nr:hypothetical protein [Elizabethkingia phage TCUEAP1]